MNPQNNDNLYFTITGSIKTGDNLTK